MSSWDFRLKQPGGCCCRGNTCLTKAHLRCLLVDPQVQKERARAAAEANRERLKAQADRNEAKDKMKGKNRPSKRHRKKQVCGSRALPALVLSNVL